MNQLKLMPLQVKPINRITSAQLPLERFEANGIAAVLLSDLATRTCTEYLCSYDGDEE
jgi:hypothetical protein